MGQAKEEYSDAAAAGDGTSGKEPGPIGRVILSRIPNARILEEDEHKALMELVPDDWATLRDHPRERDYVSHSESHHFKEAFRATGSVYEELGRVTGAILGDQVYKVDGHTRAYLYEQNQLDLPQRMWATFYKVGSTEELNNLYGTFDSQLAAEEGADKITGAFRENGIQPQSPRFRQGRITYALATAWRGKADANTRPDRPAFLDVYTVVRAYKEPIQKLDSMNPQTRTHSGIIAAGLILIAINSTYADFFERFFKGDGEKVRNKGMDGIMALMEYENKNKNSGQLRQAVQSERFAKATIQCAEKWKQGQYLSKPPRAAGKLIDYADKARSAIGFPMTPDEKTYIQNQIGKG